jgi:Flp pilus assembly protein TadB
MTAADRYGVAHRDHDTDDPQPATGRSGHAGMGHGGHGWMMMICCIPMVIIAVILVTTGVVGFGFIFAAFMCTAMMWMMMQAMGHSNPNS